MSSLARPTLLFALALLFSAAFFASNAHATSTKDNAKAQIGAVLTNKVANKNNRKNARKNNNRKNDGKNPKSDLATNKPGTKPDLSLIETTPHELALTQILAEICPPLLTPAQKKQFVRVYQAQMQNFMPTLDVKAVMTELGGRSQYRAVLNSIRAWTMSFPSNENKALCIEFAQSENLDNTVGEAKAGALGIFQ